MASNELDTTFESTTAQMSFAETSAAPPPPHVKRGLDIDLNVALPEEQYFSNSNENGREIVEEKAIVRPEDETERRNRSWEALIDVGEIALREFEENHEKAESKSKKRATRGVDELGSGSARKKRTTLYEEYAYGNLMVRSTRSRTVAMPTKYRDSVLEPVAELHHRVRSKTGKAVATKPKKSRLSGDSN